MGLIELVQRWWAHRKLTNGRCENCAVVLPDNAASRFCSDDCESEHWSHMAW